MRDYRTEWEQRVDFIRGVLRSSGANGIVYGNSGGKDSALVGILCKAACTDTVGLIMPCASQRNYSLDAEDGLKVAAQYGIETRTVDLTPVREAAATTGAGSSSWPPGKRGSTTATGRWSTATTPPCGNGWAMSNGT